MRTTYSCLRVLVRAVALHRLIIKQPIKGWFSSAFSQSPTIPPKEDRGLWLQDCKLSGWLRHCAGVIEFMYTMCKKVDPIEKFILAAESFKLIYQIDNQPRTPDFGKF